MSTDLKNAKRQRANSVDRLPPHSEEAERGVLGCCLLNPPECIADCISKFKSKAVFYDLRHQTIYECFLDMFETAPGGIDLITVQAELKNRGMLEQIGGIPYLSQLQDAVPSAANLDYYIDIVRDKWRLRNIVAIGTDMVTRVYDFEGDVDALVDQVEKDVLATTHVEDGTAKKIATVIPEAISLIEQMANNPNAITGIATGFPDFDKMTGGLQAGDMIVIAARPSMGKTSLAMNIAEHVVIDSHLPVGVFSLEMTDKSLTTRMLSSLAKVNLRNLSQGGLINESTFQKLTHAAHQLHNAPLWIDDTPGLSILQLRARARRMAQQHGIKLFVIDYLQLLHSTNQKAQDNRQQEIADISGGIKSLAKELKLPVIVASQLNREVEKDKGRKPRLSDLRESGAIEQDADLVGLLYKPEVEDEECESGEAEPVNLLIAKQRNGPTGDVKLTFLRPFTRFESAAPISAGDVPEHYETFPDAQ
jgi:replicative DNA helicase